MCCQHKLLRMRVQHLLALCHGLPWLPFHGLCLFLFYFHLLCRSCLSEPNGGHRFDGFSSTWTSSCCDTAGSEIAIIQKEK